MRLALFILFFGFTPALALAADAGPAVAVVDASVASPAVDAGVAAPPAEPKQIEDVGDALNAISTVVQLARAGQWMAFAVLLLQLLIFGIRRFTPKEFMSKWGATTVTLLSGVIALLVAVSGGTTWIEAGFVFATGALSTSVYDTLKALGILKSKSA